MSWFVDPLRNFIDDVITTIEVYKSFINKTEETISKELETYSHNKHDYCIIEYGMPTFYYKGLDSDTWDLDYMIEKVFPHLHRKSVLITLLSFMETTLNNLCEEIRIRENLDISYKDLNGKGIQRSKNYLKKLVKLPINEKECNWQKVTWIIKIRNQIVHNDNRIQNDILKCFPEIAKYLIKNRINNDYSEIIFNKGILEYVIKEIQEMLLYIGKLLKVMYNSK